MSKFLR